MNVTHGNETEFGTIIQYTCDKGYILEGIPTVVCQHGGTWSSAPPTCNGKYPFIIGRKLSIKSNSGIKVYAIDRNAQTAKTNFCDSDVCWVTYQSIHIVFRVKSHHNYIVCYPMLLK